MTRRTSIEAYNAIKENGLLGQIQWRVYQYVFYHGPCTAKSAWQAISPEKGSGVILTRFSELERMGAVETIGKTIDPHSKMPVLLWDVTDRIPVKQKKRKSTKVRCSYCDGRGFVEQLEMF